MSSALPYPPAWAGEHIADWQTRALELGWPEPTLTPEGDLGGPLGELERELLATRRERAARGRELYAGVGRPLVVLAVRAEVILVRLATGEVSAIGHPARMRGVSAASWARELGIAEHIDPARPAGLPSSTALREANKRGRTLWKRERFEPTDELGTLAARTSPKAGDASPVAAQCPPPTSAETTTPAELVWIDTETTGRSAALHQVIELAVAVTDLDGHVLRKPAGVLVALEPWSARDLSAIAVHGIDWRKPDFTARAKPMREVLTRAFARFAGRRIAGHNVAFDVGFLRASAERCNLLTPAELAAPTLDTLTYARSLKKRGLLRVDSCSLVALRAALGVGHQAHRAEGDVAATIEIYRRLRALETPALAVSA
jgi:DNA polymerase III epsilon subunit-like protein